MQDKSKKEVEVIVEEKSKNRDRVGKKRQDKG